MTLPIMNLQIATGMYHGMGVTMNGAVDTSVSAPAISSIGLVPSNISASVTWTTDQPTTGSVLYSSSPLILTEQLNSVTASNATQAMSDSNLRYSQSILITGLRAHTTYYYMVTSVNAAGIVSVSWPSMFTTKN